MDLSVLSENQVLATLAITVFSYIVGVLTNIVASFITCFDDRYFLTADYIEKHKNDKPRLKLLRESFKEIFGQELRENSWQLCYGITNLKGFGVKTGVFSSLYILCGSLAVGSLICLIACILATIVFHCLGFPVVHLGFWTTAIIGTVVFFAGEKNYTRAFSDSIHDAFLSWYYFEGPGAKSASGDAANK